MKASLDNCAASSPVEVEQPIDSECSVTKRMAKTLSTLSTQARQHPKLSELLGLSVVELCGNSDTVEPMTGAEHGASGSASTATDDANAAAQSAQLP